jgi:hypothetical protein
VRSRSQKRTLKIPGTPQESPSKVKPILKALEEVAKGLDPNVDFEALTSGITDNTDLYKKIGDLGTATEVNELIKAQEGDKLKRFLTTSISKAKKIECLVEFLCE